MIVSIMQPYFFPYLGYFQLMAAADVFVVHDDVQYIKGGWINRNRILLHAAPRLIGLPVQAAPHDRCINQRSYVADPKADRKLLRAIEAAYRDAPFFATVFGLIGEVLSFPDRNVAAFNTNLLRRVAAALALPARIVVSSQTPKDDRLRGQDRVIALVKAVGGSHYVNPVGGTELYDRATFQRNGLSLSFLRSRPHPYPQFGDAHVDALSIIDVMMFNAPGAIAQMLREFALE